MTPLIGFFIFIFGLITGSFLNVCIHRLPREQSIVKPGSHCPSCRTSIGWRDNIPLVSYLLLGGRCRSCGARISLRYFLVELLNGGIWLGFWLLYGLSVKFFVGIVFCAILLAISVSDLETGLIPDEFSFFGMAVGLTASTLRPLLHHESLWYRGLFESGLGLLGGGVLIWSIAAFCNVLFRKESMGGGDIKLVAMMGAFLGLKEIVLVFFASSFVAFPFALFALFFHKSRSFPYGPALALTGAGFFIYGDRISDYFFGWLFQI